MNMNTESKNNEQKELKPLTAQDVATLQSGKAIITNALAHFGEEQVSVICEVEGLSRAIFLSAAQVQRSIKPILGDALLREDTLMCLQGSTITWSKYILQEKGKKYTRHNGETFVAEVDGRIAMEDKALTPNYLLALPFKAIMSSMTGEVLYHPDMQEPKVIVPRTVEANDELIIEDDAIPTSKVTDAKK